MEFLVASGIGVLTASGVYLMLRRHTFPGHHRADAAVLRRERVPVRHGPARDRAGADRAEGRDAYTDPLPQALVLTAIVISFGMTALIVVLALRGYLETGSDGVEAPHEDADARIKDSRERRGSMSSAWIIAPILLPAVAAPLLILLRRHDPPCAARFPSARPRCFWRSRWASTGSPATASPRAYLLGAWPAPFGIVLVLDRLSATMVLLTAVLAFFVSIYAAGGWDLRGTAFPPAVPVPAHGHQRRLPHRRRVQPVRVLRGDADRLLRPAAAWGRGAAAHGGLPVRRDQPRRLDAVPLRRRPDLRRDRHAQHGGPRR